MLHLIDEQWNEWCVNKFKKINEQVNLNQLMNCDVNDKKIILQISA